MATDTDLVHATIILPNLIFILLLIVVSNALLLRKLISKGNFSQHPTSVTFTSLAIGDILVFLFPFLMSSLYRDSEYYNIDTYSRYYNYYYLIMLYGIGLIQVGIVEMFRGKLSTLQKYLRVVLSCTLIALPWFVATLAVTSLFPSYLDLKEKLNPSWKQSQESLSQISTIIVFVLGTLVLMTTLFLWLHIKRRKVDAGTSDQWCDEGQSRDKYVSISDIYQKKFASLNPMVKEKKSPTLVVLIFAIATGAFTLLSFFVTVQSYQNMDMRNAQNFMFTVFSLSPTIHSFGACAALLFILRLLTEQENKLSLTETKSDTKSSTSILNTSTSYSDKSLSFTEETVKERTPDSSEKWRNHLSFETFLSPTETKEKDQSFYFTDSKSMMSLNRSLQFSEFRKLTPKTLSDKQLRRLMIINIIYIVLVIPYHIFLLAENLDHKSLLYIIVSDCLMLMVLSRSFVTPLILLY
ncbi:uncharacterized protein LOC129928225 [Biomphalaria glabrata]|uniref:Uncharacterized protein LOC129928225 n=1 Tax=Biomphalaria glabrata TaxID=6526 RepID=A0A9W3BDI2_BIOGL|nr:uncharacterized protein LOC129928225 [Biomphalaria glabrata]